MERTLVLVKPDGVQRGLVGEIIRPLERKGYRLAGLKLMWVSRELAEEHYAEHRGKVFFPGLVAYITSSPLVAMVWEGRGVIQGVRRLMGATNPAEAWPGTLRGDLAIDVGRNLVHGSDSEASAAREIALFFRPEEILTYPRAGEDWLYE